jgi:hypothetical protein
VPIVWYPFERLNNFAHVYRDNAAKILGGLQGSPGWSAAAKLVVMTAEGLAMPRWNLDILQPLSQLRVETWADFSARLPAAEVVNGNGSSSFVPAGHTADSEDVPALSVEGGPQRCFRHMFVCTEGLNTSSWPLHGLGQHLAQRYGQQLSQSWGGGTAPPRDGSTSRLKLQPLQQQHVAAQQKQEGARTRVLRILFHKRSSTNRQLLNVEELLRECNAWRHSSKGTGMQLRASCAEVELPSLHAGIAAAQEADVFIGMHGMAPLRLQRRFLHSFLLPAQLFAPGLCDTNLSRAPCPGRAVLQAPTWQMPGSCAPAAA